MTERNHSGFNSSRNSCAPMLSQDALVFFLIYILLILFDLQTFKGVDVVIF